MKDSSNRKKLIFRGVATAMITPFADGGIDFDALAEMTDYQLDSGISALVVCGTTGEAPTLSQRERAAVISFVAERVGGRVPVIAGVGSNDTAATVTAAVTAAEADADAVMVVTPYYNKPTQSGLIAHFTAVADTVTLPVILYNVPGRTGVSLTAETCRVLAQHENIVALKEASGTAALTAYCTAELDSALAVYSGCDELTLPLLSLGAEGVISVVSNAVPRAAVRLCDAFFSGDNAKAAYIAHALTQLTEALFAVSNPIPVKAACAALGLCKNELRLPLMPLSEKDTERLYRLVKNVTADRNI